MSLLTELSDIDNLKRAWNWIRTNPDVSYKYYFRQLYSIYALADDALITDLRDRLRRGVYEPSHACKIFLPKLSGILRPYTLLSVEDQIVYQAAINVVAERLFPRVRSRYNREVFGHLYAGRVGIWFYRKWSEGYRKFNEATRKAVADGYIYAASFDLTACYDSLDHGVLKHFLIEIGCDKEFCDLLIGWLNTWTATEHRIYHNHGIPQGPLSSGLLSEVVLKHFDEKRGREATVVYFRYVDDIRLFAKHEKALRQMLVRLDHLSKDVGLFPQSSKISIHKVTDIESELKSVSRPTERAIKGAIVNQVKLRRRIVELTPRYRIANPTRFKFLLAHAVPDSSLTARLWRIYENSPEYYVNIAKYLERYDAIPKKAAQRLVNVIKSQDLYSTINASFIDALNGRLPKNMTTSASRVISQKWKPQSPEANLLASVGKWLLKYDQFTFGQTENACLKIKPWWARTQIVLSLDDHLIGKTSLETLLNKALRSDSLDVAVSAAYVVYLNNLGVAKPFNLFIPAHQKY